MNTCLRRLLICGLVLSWLGGLSAWAADFDILHAAPGYSEQVDVSGGDCFNPADHCEHGMAHWIGLPAHSTTLLWSPIVALLTPRPEHLTSLSLPPEPQPPRS